MTVPTEPNDEVAQSSIEPQVLAEDVERVDEISQVSLEPHIIAEDKEMMAGEVFENSPELQIAGEEMERVAGGTQTSSNSQALDEGMEGVSEGTQTSSESQIVAEEMNQYTEVPRALLEPQVVAEKKGRVSEGSQTSPEPLTIAEVKGRVRPSSLRTRPSTRTKRTVTFKDDFGKVEEPQVQRPGARRQVGERQQKMPPAFLGFFLSLALASLILYIATPSMPSKPQLWTSAELEKYNGTDNKPPLLLGILGSVFDVSKGWKHYGPGGSYHHYVGRDASRAFVSGNFTDDGLTDSLEGLTASQIKAIDDWRLFFVSRYIYLGKLVGTFYNKDGLPTKKLHLAEKMIRQASKFEKHQKLDEERYPNCNSRWTQGEGGEVWCDDGKFPRIVELVTEGPSRGPPRTRCACIKEEELQRPGLKGYDGCDAQSSKCQT